MMKQHMSSSKIRSRRIKCDYYKNPNRCRGCNKLILYNKRLNVFCDHSCAASHNNKGVRRYGNPEERDDRYTGFCIYCGGMLNKNSLLYCSSSQCQKEYDYLIFINKWKLGLEDGVSGKRNTSRYIKEYLRRKHNNKCQECGWCQVNIKTKTTPLHLHHVDGDHTNNKEYNLELLCPNCHSITENFGSLNIGNSSRVFDSPYLNK